MRSKQIKVVLCLVDQLILVSPTSANMKRLDAMGKQGGQTYPRHPAFFAGIFLRSVRPLPPRCVPREFCR